MKIIGIDPGLAATGIGLVTGTGYRIDEFSYGSIYTASGTALAARLDCIYTKLITLVKKERPDLMVIEDVFSLHRFPKSGINLGQVSKHELEKTVRDVLRLTSPIRPYHASDALALALIGLYRFG